MCFNVSLGYFIYFSLGNEHDITDNKILMHLVGHYYYMHKMKLVTFNDCEMIYALLSLFITNPI